METLVRHVIVFPLAYLLGAFPTGYLAVRALAGRDVRRWGSGRTGGTNVLRAAGVVPALLTILGDGLKGGLALLLARAIGGTPFSLAIAGVAAILGHNYSVFLGWSGGAGTIVNIGAALFIHPLVGAAAIAAGGATLGLSRYASLASVAVAVALPLLYGAAALWGGMSPVLALYGAVAGLIAIIALRPNIARLLAGTERRVGRPLSATARE
jgi:glycerol-3-phosphate acyltransferase PlsY